MNHQMEPLQLFELDTSLEELALAGKQAIVFLHTNISRSRC